MENKIDPFLKSSTFHMFLAIVLIGIDTGQFSLGKKIINNLIKLQPENSHAYITLSFIAMKEGNILLQFDILKQVCTNFPENQMARAYLSGCMKMLDLKGWMPLAESVIADNDDPDAVMLAHSLLGNPEQSTAHEDVVDQTPSAPINAIWL